MNITENEIFAVFWYLMGGEAHTHMNIHKYMNTHTHMNIHTHIHEYTYTQ